MANKQITTDAAIKMADTKNTQQELEELLNIATESGEVNLELAVRARARTLGFTATPGKARSFANRVQRDFEQLVQKQGTTVSQYATSLKQKQVTADYVSETTNIPLFFANVDSITGDAVRHREAAAENYQRILRQLGTITTSSDPNAALLAETRSSKIWTRLERRLASTEDKYGVINTALQAAAAGTEEEQRLTAATIITEAIPYLEATGNRDAGQLIEQMLQRYSPELASAYEQMVTADKVLALTRSNASAIRAAFTKGIGDAPNSTDKVYGYISLDTAF